MTTQINTDFTVSFLVINSNGLRMTDDAPVATIKNIDTNLYWNGVIWQSNSFSIILSHMMNGVYIYTFKPSVCGVYEISCVSSKYGLRNIQTAIIYDGESLTYNWLINSTHTIKLSSLSDQETGQVKIYRDIDKTYFDGNSWNNNISWISMTNLSGVIYYAFVPDQNTIYDIEVQTSENQKLEYILNVSENSDSITPVLIDSRTFLSNDGTDTKLIDNLGNNIFGVKVSCYDLSSPMNLIVAGSMTDSLGNWSLSVKPGTYYFMFEKEGYVSTGFERQVS